MEQFITAEEVAGLHYRDLIDLMYDKLQTSPTQLYSATIQYRIKDGETCTWSIELIDEQDIADASIFAKGLSSINDDNVQLDLIRFSSISAPKWGGNNWRESADSQAIQEGGS